MNCIKRSIKRTHRLISLCIPRDKPCIRDSDRAAAPDRGGAMACSDLNWSQTPPVTLSYPVRRDKVYKFVPMVFCLGLGACTSMEVLTPAGQDCRGWEDSGCISSEINPEPGDGSNGLPLNTGKSSCSPQMNASGIVSRYDYSFNLKTGEARTQLTIQPPPDGLTCVGLSSALPISDFTWNGVLHPFLMNMGSIYAGGGRTYDEPVQVGADVIVPRQASLVSNAGFYEKASATGGTFAHLTSWVSHCDYLGPCDVSPSQLVEIHLDVSHDPGQVVLCPGNISSSPGKTRCDIVDTLAPTYSGLAVAANSQWVRTPYAKGGGAQVVIYEAPGGVIASSLNKPHIIGFLEWITDFLGPLPYGKELRVATGPIDWLGYEHPANIMLREDLPMLPAEYADMTTHTLMHEIAHQWAGNRTTLASGPDFVWKEAVADYLVYAYEDEFMAPNIAGKTREYWDRLAKTTSYYPVPKDMPAPPLLELALNSYGTGPILLLLQLEPYLGRKAIISGLANFLKDANVRGVHDLQVALEESSGLVLDSYFDAWVNGVGDPDWPYFNVSLKQAGNKVQVTVSQETLTGKIYPCVVDIMIAGATQAVVAHVDFGLHPTSAVAEGFVILPEPYIKYEVDSQHRVVNRKYPPSMLKKEKEVDTRVWQL